MDMTYEQFFKYKSLETKELKEEYYQKCLEENMKTRKRAKFVLDSEWLSVYDITELLTYMKLDQLENEKSKKGKILIAVLASVLSLSLLLTGGCALYLADYYKTDKEQSERLCAELSSTDVERTQTLCAHCQNEFIRRLSYQ